MYFRNSYRSQRVLRQGTCHCSQMVCSSVRILHLLICCIGVLNFYSPLRRQRGRGDPHQRYRFELTHITQYLPLSQLPLQRDLNRLRQLVSPHLQINPPLVLRSSPNPQPLLLIILFFLPGKRCAPLNRSWKWRKRMHSKPLGRASKHATLLMRFTYWRIAEVPNPNF